MRSLLLFALLPALALAQAKKPGGGGGTFSGGTVSKVISSTVAASGHALEIPQDVYLCLDGATCAKSLANLGGAITITSGAGVNIAVPYYSNFQVYGPVVAAAAFQNNLKLTGDDSPNPPRIIAQGADSNIDISIEPKGTGYVKVPQLKFTDGSTQTTAGGGCGYGTFSQLGTVGPAGACRFANDAPVQLWVSNGSAWHPYFDVVGTQPSAASNWTAFNQGSTTLTDKNGALHYHMPAGSGSTQVRGYCQSLGSNTHFEAAFTTNFVGATTGYPSVALLALKESGTGKLITFGIVEDINSAAYGVSSPNFFIEHGVWASATSRSSSAIYKFPLNASRIFLKMELSGGNTLLEIGNDNTSWYTVATIATTSWATTAANQFCVAGISWSNVEAYDYDVVSLFAG